MLFILVAKSRHRSQFLRIETIVCLVMIYECRGFRSFSSFVYRAHSRTISVASVTINEMFKSIATESPIPSTLFVHVIQIRHYRLFSLIRHRFGVDFKLTMKLGAECACANITIERNKHESNGNSNIRCVGGHDDCAFIPILFLSLFRFRSHMCTLRSLTVYSASAQCTTFAANERIRRDFVSSTKKHMYRTIKTMKIN